MKTYKGLVDHVVHLHRGASSQKGRNLQMPGDGRYQPDVLKPDFGYDQWAGWLVIIEWFWLLTLAKIGVMPKSDAELLTEERLLRLLYQITTTKQDKVEKETRHDILALLQLMRQRLPKRLHRWLHFSATSYDIINTAYALQLKYAYTHGFWSQACDVDRLWRREIEENVSVVQAGRTHLQTALPVTVGLWLAVLHNRFVNNARRAYQQVLEVPGKFSGAVGTSAAQRVLIRSRRGEKVLMKMLGLKAAEISTQITPPEEMARFYFDLVLVSGALANLGEDTRILQSSQFGEIITAGSSSSAMPHKEANPTWAEQDAGMHNTVVAESLKLMLTLVSDLQRDLRWSNVMRSFSAVMVYTSQQLISTYRLFNSFKVDVSRCQENFERKARLVVAELLHLALQREGFADSHHFVNQTIVPAAALSGNYLDDEVKVHLEGTDDPNLQKAWADVPVKVKRFLRHPEEYLGDAIEIAKNEAQNRLAA